MDIKDLEMIVSDVTGRKIFIQNPNSKISNLKIDSLDYLEVVVEIEQRIGKNLPDDTIFMCNTVDDLLRIVNNA